MLGNEEGALIPQKEVVVSERDVKQKQWDAKKAEIDQIVDGMGRGVDQRVKDSVVALNLLGINTLGSCEGHVDSGTGAPNIAIGPQDTIEIEELDSKIQNAFEGVQRAEDGVALDEETIRQYDEYEKNRIERKKITVDAVRDSFGYLDEFYKDRQVPYKKRLILVDVKGLHFSLQSQGADIQETLPLDEREEKLEEYQEEMREFTDFLKGKFFGVSPQLHSSPPAAVISEEV